MGCFRALCPRSRPIVLMRSDSNSMASPSVRRWSGICRNQSDATTDSIPVADPEADKTHSMVVVEHVVVEESEYLDVEVVEMDSGALSIGASGRMKAVPEPETAEQPTLFDEVATPTMAIRTISEADFDPEEALTDEMAAAEPEPEAEPEVDVEPTTDVHEAIASDEEQAEVAPEPEPAAEAPL